MANDITLLHITDPHLCAAPGTRLHGWDVAAAFERILNSALGAHPDADALVLGGDLVDDESEAGYRWLDARLAETGRPAGQVYLHLRLDKADELLRETGLKIAEIGTLTGFPNPTHFARAMRMHTGQPPRERRVG